MSNALFEVPEPKTEPILNYAPGSKEKGELKSKLVELKKDQIEVPAIIGGKEIRTGKLGDCIIPHNREFVLAKYHKSTQKEVDLAIKAAKQAWIEWSRFPWEERAAILLKAAELLSGPWRGTLNAATMLNQSKTAFQAEIDSACELIDFFRFNTYFMTQIYQNQPYSSKGIWNRVDYRPLEGFIFAVTPFNFTSIAGNLPTSPALMGNTVIWKPASTAVLSGYFVMRLLQCAGMPDGVINFLPGTGREFGPDVLVNPELGGVHFTGSTETFQGMWRTIGENIARYKSYPRIVGETGGKDFFFIHPSFTDIDALAAGIVRGAFEYQGQKCSAASRGYIPASLWPKLRARLIEMIETIKVGDVEDFTNFMSAVIDNASFQKNKSYIEYAKKSNEDEILVGGKCDDRRGFFVWPTVIQTQNPKSKLMEEEIFGPIFSAYVYKDSQFEETLSICNETSPYGLTGCIWAHDRKAVMKALDIVKYAAGNFYINDKPTGAVVGQQPFGGSRASGTNDKAGSLFNLIRWTTPQAIKENFAPPMDYRYPFMKES